MAAFCILDCYFFVLNRFFSIIKTLKLKIISYFSRESYELIVHLIGERNGTFMRFIHFRSIFSQDF